MGKYDKIDDAKVFVGGVYFQPGLYRVQIDAVKEGVTRKKEEFFCIECTILESNNPHLGAGKMVSQLIMLKQDAALSNIKQFAGIVDGREYDKVDGKLIDLMVSADNPASGEVVGVEATMIKTRAGDDFTKVVWLTDEDIKEKLKAAGVAAKAVTATATATA